MTGLLARLSVWRARRRARLSAKATRTERPDGGIGAEALIRTASEDRLRRADFADRIAGVLSELSLREGRVSAAAALDSLTSYEAAKSARGSAGRGRL